MPISWILNEWYTLETRGPASEPPEWLLALVDEYPRLRDLIAEHRKPMTPELQLKLDEAAERARKSQARL